MTYNYNSSDFYNGPTNIKSKHFSEFINNRLLSQSYQGFHLTLTYKQCNLPVIATKHLKTTVSLFLKKAIASRWDRQRYQNTFEIHAFLDTPGSRARRSFLFESLDHVQDGYHHHCIILAKRHIHRKIVYRIYSEPSIKATHVIIPRAPAKSIHLVQVDADQIRYLANYAAKSVPLLSKVENDDYYHFFDHRGSA